MSLLTLMLFHPDTPSLVAGIAHIAVYFAVLAPLFWAPMLVNTPERLAQTAVASADLLRNQFASSACCRPTIRRDGCRRSSRGS